MTVKLTVLGCGNSAGTPTIGNYWGNCDPDNPKNRRTRASIAVQSDQTTLVIDTGADFKEQVNRANITRFDAILYTHAHADHIAGMDELRVVRNRTKQMVEIYGNQATIDELRERFNYMFVEKARIYPKVFNDHIITDEQLGQPMTIGDIEFTPFGQDHGTMQSLGFRFGDIAYSTDMVDLDQDALETLKGVKTWIVDAAGYKMEKNVVHCTLRDLYALNDIVQAERVYITHLTPLMDYETLLRETPDGYEPAYDGLSIDISI